MHNTIETLFTPGHRNLWLRGAVFVLVAGLTPLVMVGCAETAEPSPDPEPAATGAAAANPGGGDRRGGTLGTSPGGGAAPSPAGGVETTRSELTLGQNSTPTGTVANGVSIDVIRSTLVNDPAVLGGFSFQAVLDQIVALAGKPGLTSLGLFQQIFRTMGTTPSAGPDDPRCSATVNEFPNEGCPQFPDANQATENPFTPNVDPFYFPTALVNRVDLIPTDGAHCGEYRVIFARQSGVPDNAGAQPSFLIFEAVLRNPHPEIGLEGCRPVQAFWRDLSTVSSVTERARRLRSFYFDGLPGFRPVFHPLHYGDSPFSTGGRLRVSSGRTRPWQFFEYKLNCGSSNPCNLVAQPVTNKETPNEQLFETNAAAVPGSIRDRYQLNLVSNVQTLAINDINRFFLASAPDEFNSADSKDRDNIPFVDVFGTGPSTTFRSRLQTELTRIGSTLTPENIVVRAESLSCHGCHATSTGAFAGLGGGVILPDVPGAVQVSARIDTATGRFRLSDALSTAFLPHRRNVMVSFLNTANALRAFKVSAAPVIDGHLNEPSWELTNNGSKLVQGASDNDTVWSATWNDTTLFLGARVFDANLTNDSGTSFWEDDGVEFYIDGNRNRSTTYDANDRQYTIRYNDATVREKANRLTGVVGAWARINGGYSVEIAIPWSTIGVTASAGKQVGFDVAVNDDDNGGVRDGKLVGVGTANNHLDTSAFGTIVLDAALATTAIPSRVLSPRDTPAIDGRPGEWSWSLATEVHKQTSGALSNRVRWSVTYNDSYLMVAVLVKDASLRNDSTNVRDDDSVEIYIDGQNNGSATYDANDLQYIKGYNDSTLFEKNGRTTGVLHTSTALPGGYGVEIAVPWARLGFSSQPPANTVIGFDVGVNDDSNGGARDGAAVCFGDANNSTSTVKFGDLKLSL